MGKDEESGGVPWLNAQAGHTANATGARYVSGCTCRGQREASAHSARGRRWQVAEFTKDKGLPWGHRRCPNCGKVWYSADQGNSWPCPECGAEIGPEGVKK